MRNKISKLAMFMTVLCMTVSMFAVNASAADGTTSIDSCTKVVESYDLDDAQDYINDGDTSTYPTKEGYVFGGWYTDEECGEDSYWGQEEPGDTVYALFVPSHVLSVKAQISANLLDGDTSDDGSASIRFVTTVDTLYYTQAGFTVSYVNANGETRNVTNSSNTVYKKLYAIGAAATDDKSDDVDYTEENILEYTPSAVFCNQSTYFKACTVRNIGSEYYTTPFTVTPFWRTMDGSIVYGETVIKSINDYFLENEVYVSSQMSNAADTVENGSKEKPFKTLEYALGMVQNEGTVHIIDSYTATSSFVWKDHDKTITITGGSLDFTAVPTITIDDVETPALQINDAVTFASTTLVFANGQHIYANGNSVEIASSVTWGDSSAYVWIYGGAYKTTLKSGTSLVLGAGKYARVFGGGNYNDVTGNVNVTISGDINNGIDYANHTMTYAAFGGGQNGSDIIGNINLTIADETVLFDRIYGGGWSSKVTGDITVNFSGKSMSVYGGGYYGTVTGDTRLVVSGTNAWVEQLFGGCQGASMTGNTNVDVQSGTVKRRVYGGCYNDTTGTLSLSFTTEYCVTGHTNVTISPNATFSLNYTDSGVKLDNSIYAISRGAGAFSGEWSAFIFNADSYTNTYSSKLGYSGSLYSSYFSSQTYHYLITTNGNTSDGSYGTVSSEGDYIRIEPNSGYSATVTVAGTQEYYTESEAVFKLPELTNKTDTKNIVVTFGEIDSSVDESRYEARIDGAYYDTLEEAVDAAMILATEDTIPYVTLLKNAEVETTMEISGAVSVGINGSGYTINRADDLLDGCIFTVSKGNTLTIENVVLDGRTTTEIEAGTTELDLLTGSAESLIFNTGAVNLSKVTAQYAVKEAANGAILRSGGSTDVVTIEDSTFRYNRAAGQGGAIRMGGNTVRLEVTNSTFEYNEVYTLTTTDDEGTVSVSAKGLGGALAIYATSANVENCKFVGNTAEGYSEKKDGRGGAIYCGSNSVVTITGTDENAVFESNCVTYGYGGAVTVESGKTTVIGYTFTTNESDSYGGAIFTTGSAAKIKSVSCYFEGNTSGARGGAAYAGSSSTMIFDVDTTCSVKANLSNNIAATYGGAIGLGTDSYVKVTGYLFEGNHSSQPGGAVYNDAGTLTLIGDGGSNSKFNGNNTTGNGKVGGAIYSTGILNVKAYTFDDNYATGAGGAINNDGTMTIIDTVFTKNGTDTYGGAVHNNGGTATIVNTKFEANTSEAQGGAIANTNHGSLYLYGTSDELGVTNATNAIFKENIANNTTSGYGGGAIYNNASKGEIVISGYEFAGNTAKADGGALCSRTAVTLSECTFTGNSTAKNGGVVYLYNYTATITDCLFGGDDSEDGNKATGEAGAIYTAKGTINATDTDFVNNTAASGGAISVGYATVNTETTTGEDGTETTTETIVYTDGTLTVTNCDFASNIATSGTGGAIDLVSGIATLSATDNSTFVNNKTNAASGGAIYNTNGTLTMSGYQFSQNEAYDEGGAVYNKATFNTDNCIFDGNVANSTTQIEASKTTNMGGGAIYNNGGSMTIETSVFTKNESKSLGGAICNYNKVATITDCTFGGTDTEGNSLGNIAGTNGGAIYSGGGVQIIIQTGVNSDMAVCSNNSAAKGGAIGLGTGTLTITGYTFSGNSVTEYGGAIYSGGNGTMQTCTFTGNSAAEGGAAYIAKSPTLDSCVFKGNSASTNGGAVYCKSGAAPTLTDCQFGGETSTDKNSAKCGGAICNAGTLNVTRNVFQFNATTATSSSYQGGAVYNSGTANITDTGFDNNSAYQGGAIYSSGALTLGVSMNSQNAYFKNNTAKNNGGAIYIAGVSGATISATGYEFDWNTSGAMGGAVSLNNITGSSNVGVKASFETCIFTRNSAGGAGGAIANNQYSKIGTVSETIVTNCIFGDSDDNTMGNNATTKGGAIFLNLTSEATVSGSKFYYNTDANGGGAIYNQLQTQKLTVGTCEFKGNTPKDIWHDTDKNSIANFVDAGGNTGDSDDGTYSSNASSTQ